MDVLGAVEAPDLAEHDREVVVERARRKHAADRRLPGMPVGVDEAGHHDHPGGVDLFRVRDAEVRADVDDLSVLDEDLSVRNVADVGIDRDDEAVADQKPLRAHGLLLSLFRQEFGAVVLRRRMYSDHKRSRGRSVNGEPQT